jgi:hypothetical protein
VQPTPRRRCLARGPGTRGHHHVETGSPASCEYLACRHYSHISVGIFPSLANSAAPPAHQKDRQRGANLAHSPARGARNGARAAATCATRANGRAGYSAPGVSATPSATTHYSAVCRARLRHFIGTAIRQARRGGPHVKGTHPAPNRNHAKTVSRTIAKTVQTIEKPWGKPCKRLKIRTEIRIV